MSAEGLRAAVEKMRGRGMPEVAIGAFERAYRHLEQGDEALLADSAIEPVGDVTALADLPELDAAGRDALDRVALIKLNGGLATTMGLTEPKSLLPAKDGLSFLDVIVRRTLALREETGARLPLVLMDSDSTRAPTLAALDSYPQLAAGGLPLDFLQHIEPKLDAHTLAPVSWPASPELEWCPPGHGDVYTALLGSGVLDALLDAGIGWVMISNADNLGATLEPRIPAHLAREGIPFLMEVAEATEADRKGGHLARGPGGRLVLRESAQVPKEDETSFRDYRRWRWYNTNSLWVDLGRLSELLREGGGSLDLPLIVNRKTVDPRDAASPPVLQLESAMGAAIGSFEGAQLLHVPRSRFIPVKTTDDLLVLRSDAYELTDAGEVRLAPGVESAPFVALDRERYGLLADFDRRFPAGPPSLREARRLEVQGDVTFEGGVVVRGDAEIDNRGQAPVTVESGSVIGT